jgi:hypothetical protein
MPRVSVYIRPTTGNRTPKKAAKGSTGPFYLRYELNGKRVWESLTTRTYTFALADARSKESSLLLGEATPVNATNEGHLVACQKGARGFLAASGPSLAFAIHRSWRFRCL